MLMDRNPCCWRIPALASTSMSAPFDRWISTFAFCSLLAAPSGCTPRAGERGDSYSMNDSAGVVIVESHAPAWTGDSLIVEREPFVQIGSEEAGPYRFAF